MENQNQVNPVSDNLNEKKAYHTPQVRHYGSLAELVQFNAGKGSDGEVVWLDCTLS